MRHLIFLAAFLFPCLAESTVDIGPQNWNRYQGTRIIARGFPTLAACAAADPGKYTCRTSVAVTVTNQTPPPPPPVEPPAGESSALYTDLLTGPAGAPLTVCGRGFGTTPIITIGGQPAPVLDTKASHNTRFDCVRVNAGNSGAIAVNGVASSLTYTAVPGSLLYVSLTGDDASAVKGDPAKPWRHVQGSAERSGALGAASAGDVLVLRGGEWSDVGYGGRWFRLLTRGDVAVVSYPGEDVHYSGNPRGGIHGPDSGHSGQAPNVVLSGLRIDAASNSSSDGAPINLQYGADGWRVINNDLSWPDVAGHMLAAGIAGHGSNVAILGNHIHDIAGGPENHGIYIDGGNGGNTGYDISYNLITRVTGGNLLQIYDPLSRGVRAVKLHDNDLTHGGRYGLNLAVQTVSIEAWDNLISDTALSGIRLNMDTIAESDIYVHGNTLTNVNTKGSPSSAGAINCDSRVTSGRALIEANKIASGPGAKSYYSQYGQCPALQFKGNTWSGIEGQTGP